MHGSPAKWSISAKEGWAGFLLLVIKNCPMIDLISKKEHDCVYFHRKCLAPPKSGPIGDKEGAGRWDGCCVSQYFSKFKVAK